MIRLRGVTKIFKMGESEIRALDGVDLDIAEGERIVVSGPSGSGKSTLLNIIGCLDLPTSGTVSLFGEPVAGQSDRRQSALRNSNIGFVFQSFNLIPVLTAAENVEYPMIVAGVPRRERREKVAAILEKVGLARFVKHRPEKLSGGQRQRVAIARALVNTPKLVLADEPTAALDSGTSREILDLMANLNEEMNTTFIFSTHDPMVQDYAKRRLALHDGAMVA
ncbi:ABC transporter ATP-binding protein [Fodinicurvata sp. EGI_FJ10296]|uniref:ABC transporter ATP-binding protein n=1 Tax=Fodinicurvata sp. EGI_FJ10296 TaxID=3231908 RepID=UPI0034527F38